MSMVAFTWFSRLLKGTGCIGLCCLIVFFLTSCCNSRSVLISDSKEFRDLIGLTDELEFECGLFVKKGSENLTLVSAGRDDDKDLIGIIPKGTKVKIVSVYRKEYYRIDGNVYLTADFPTLEFEVDGKKYKDVDAAFNMLRKNGSSRPVLGKIR